MEQKLFRLRSSNLEAYHGSDLERINLEFAEVGQDGKFLNDGTLVSIRSTGPVNYNMVDTYSIILA